MTVQPVPGGYHAVTPYMIVDGASEAIEFYKEAFAATERMRLSGESGKVMHAEIAIGDSVIMLADEFPEMNIRGPKSFGGSPVSLALYVENVDDVFGRAVEAGCVEVRPVATQFYGDRTGTLTDPWGHQWTIATHVEDVSPEEMQKRMAAGGH